MTTALAVTEASQGAASQQPDRFALHTLPGYEPDLPAVLTLVGREPPATPRPHALPAAPPEAGPPAAGPLERVATGQALPAWVGLPATAAPAPDPVPPPARSAPPLLRPTPPLSQLTARPNQQAAAAGHADDEQRVNQAKAIALALLRAVFEVLEGRRPIAQLPALTSTSLCRRLLLATARPATNAAEPGRVAVNRVSLPCPGVIEVAATLHRPHRVRAVAARAEIIEGRWCYTVLHVL